MIYEGTFRVEVDDEGLTAQQIGDLLQEVVVVDLAEDSGPIAAIELDYDTLKSGPDRVMIYSAEHDLYWSNRDGWVDPDNADSWSVDEPMETLPIGGEIVPTNHADNWEDILSMLEA